MVLSSQLAQHTHTVFLIAKISILNVHEKLTVIQVSLSLHWTYADRLRHTNSLHGHWERPLQMSVTPPYIQYYKYVYVM